MAKGYWIGRIDVHDEEAYKDYLALNGIAFAKFGGIFLVRGGSFENPRGQSRARNVVIEFPSYEMALACFTSPEYQAALEAQKGGAELDLVIIRGYEGPQPA